LRHALSKPAPPNSAQLKSSATEGASRKPMGIHASTGQKK
jgi:hypothetical protein